MTNFKPTDKGMVAYREYFTGLEPEYITIFGGKVISSISPKTKECVYGGIQLKTVDELRIVTEMLLNSVNTPCYDVDYERHYFNGKNFGLAKDMLLR
jgi:hypothetical protein